MELKNKLELIVSKHEVIKVLALIADEMDEKDYVESSTALRDACEVIDYEIPYESPVKFSVNIDEKAQWKS